MSYVTTVTIGRNVPGPDAELPVLEWETFIDEVSEVWGELAYKRQLEATLQHQPDAFFLEVHQGVGVWDGVKEESAKVTIVSEFVLTGKGDAITRTHEICKNYRQEAFALTVGESVLYETN